MLFLLLLSLRKRPHRGGRGIAQPQSVQGFDPEYRVNTVINVKVRFGWTKIRQVSVGAGHRSPC